MIKVIAFPSYVDKVLGEANPMGRERYQDPAIQRNANGSYFIRPYVDVRNSTGELVRQKRTYILGGASASKRELATEKKLIMEPINNGGQIARAQILFEELVKVYRTRYLSTLAYSSVCLYECLLKKHILPELGPLPLYRITGVQIDEWFKSKQLSWASKLNLRKLLASIFSKAREWKLYTEDSPLEFVSVGRKQAVYEREKLTDLQTRELLGHLPADVRLMVWVALSLGLRVSEILGLKERDLNFQSGAIQITKRFYRGDYDRAKTDGSERKVPMGLLASELQKLCLGDNERFIFNIAAKTDALMSRRDDRYIQQNYLRPAAVAAKCYRKGFGFHSFRREAITQWNATLGVTQAMRLAGHTKPSMSALYTLADFGRQDQAIRARQGELMGEGKSGDVIN